MLVSDALCTLILKKEKNNEIILVKNFKLNLLEERGHVEQQRIVKLVAVE